MYQFGIGIIIAGMKSYMELNIAKLTHLVGASTMLEMIISVKYYLDDTNNGNRINVDGYTVSLDFHWFPTIIN